MDKESALLSYFPTTVALVDDKEDYLKLLKKNLTKDVLVYKTFPKPKEALEYLEKNATLPPFLENCVRQEEDTARGHRNIDINLYPIRDELYNPKRFEQLSVLVIDQEMPGLKGLEICEKIKKSPIKKILLTGEVDDKQAIEAFNNGVIDQFIPKDADNFYDLLNNTIAEQANNFMRQSLRPIANGLTQMRPGYDESCLIEPEFKTLLGDIVKKHDICEYYLSDDNGSYIFLDKTGKPSWLVLKDDDEMEADYYLAEDSDTPPSKDVLEGLKNHKLILHLFTEQEEKTVLASDWKAHDLLFPAKELKCKNRTYYYAYIDNPDAHEVNRDKIVSFKTFQSSLGGK